MGCGVILGGQLLASRHQGAGVSFGHATIHAGGRTCLCGNIGCAETVVSANAVVGRLREYVTRKVPSIVTDRFADDPGSISFATLTDAAQEGDRVALEVLDAFERSSVEGRHVMIESPCERPEPLPQGEGEEVFLG